MEILPVEYRLFVKVGLEEPGYFKLKRGAKLPPGTGPVNSNTTKKQNSPTKKCALS